jgi:hypothetical protein
MVQTDVGIKCPDDARLPRGARAGAMKTGQVIRSLLAGVAVAVVGTAVVYAIFQVGFLTLILSAVAGYGAGTFIHRAGGRYGGPLQVLAGGEVPIFRVLTALVAVGFAIYNSR